MFERYTEKARRVIFFARYEASQFGTPYIETEHLLLGLVREDKKLAALIERGGASEEFIRKQIEVQRHAREKIPTSVDMPLSQESKRVLAYAAEEAERLSHRHIGTEHLMLGLLREKDSLAAEILRGAGFELASLRDELARPHTPASAPVGMPPLLAELSRNLSEAARRNELDPLIGRTAEFDHMIQILCRSERNNVALLGEPGVGKQAAVEGLACRIAKGDVPSRLEGAQVVQIVLSPIVAILRETPRVQDRLTEVLSGLASPANTIYFIEGLFDTGGAGSVETARLLRPLLSLGEIQCIAVGTPREYQTAAEREPWLEDCFRTVELSAPSESEAIQILFAAKPRYERFHSVKYTDEALKQAVALSQRFLPDCCLPDKAIDLIDDAGAACALRQGALPQEVRAAQQRLMAIRRSMDRAVANHEFLKGRTYSDEETKQRDELRTLLEKHSIDLEQGKVVDVDDIEEAVAQRAGIPVEEVRKDSSSGAGRSEGKG